MRRSSFLFLGTGVGVDGRKVNFAKNHRALHAGRGACGEHLGFGGLRRLFGGCGSGLGLVGGFSILSGFRFGGLAGGFGLGSGFCLGSLAGGFGLGGSFRFGSLAGGLFGLARGLHGVALFVELDFAENPGLLTEIGGRVRLFGLGGLCRGSGGGGRALLLAVVGLLIGTSL